MLLEEFISRISGPGSALEYPIGEALEFGSTVVVRLEVPVGEVFNENVFGLSWDGRIKWQVAGVGQPDRDNPIVSIQARSNRVRLLSWSGIAVELDPESGSELSRELVR